MKLFMTSSVNHCVRPFVVLLAMFILSLPFTACSGGGSDSGDGGCAVAWEHEKVVDASAGSIYLKIAEGSWPGTTWTAEIVDGTSWLSFSASQTLLALNGKVGTTLASKRVAVYFNSNTTGVERQGTVRFTFAGQPSIELSLTQAAKAGAADSESNAATSWAWPEMPAKREGANYTYVTHYAPVKDQSQGGVMVTKRNFSLCFDKSKRASAWVAYPLHEVYMGSSPRPDEPWTYDPKIESSWQANLSKGSYNGSPVRGHQIANADRNAHTTMQHQTFYCSNSTPQNYSLNGGGWMRLESKVRGWSCSDTLYVVTGAFWENGSSTTTDKSGNVCPIPSHYFKVVARTRQGNVRKKGDRLGDYKADALQTIGFWVANKSSQGEAKDWVKSVQEIEQLTGFEFFPTLPKEVKTQKSASQWGL